MWWWTSAPVPPISDSAPPWSFRPRIGKQIWIPIGFGHGLCTLEPGTEVVYKLTAPYDPASERGIAWDDPDLAIAWPIGQAEPHLSDRDRQHPRLAESPKYF